MLFFTKFINVCCVRINRVKSLRVMFVSGGVGLGVCVCLMDVVGVFLYNLCAELRNRITVRFSFF